MEQRLRSLHASGSPVLLRRGDTHAGWADSLGWHRDSHSMDGLHGWRSLSRREGCCGGAGKVSTARRELASFGWHSAFYFCRKKHKPNKIKRTRPNQRTNHIMMPLKLRGSMLDKHKRGEDLGWRKLGQGPFTGRRCGPSARRGLHRSSHEGIAGSPASEAARRLP